MPIDTPSIGRVMFYLHTSTHSQNPFNLVQVIFMAAVCVYVLNKVKRVF